MVPRWVHGSQLREQLSGSAPVDEVVQDQSCMATCALVVQIKVCERLSLRVRMTWRLSLRPTRRYVRAVVASVQHLVDKSLLLNGVERRLGEWDVRLL